MIKLQYRFILLVNLCLSLLSLSLNGQDDSNTNWQLQNFDEGRFNGINAYALYDYLSSQSYKPKPVIVGILDSGIEVDHEDMNDVMWVNTDEIAGNGQDDDNNGYIDDIHGWNFLGGPDGKNVNADTYEQTRLVAKYMKYFENKDLESLNKKDQKLYDQYLEMKESTEKSMQSAKNQYEALNSQATMIQGLVDEVKVFLGDRSITRTSVETIPDTSAGAKATKSFLVQVLDQVGDSIGTADDLEKLMVADLQDGLHYYENKYKYAHNPEFDPRHIIGDNFADKYEKHYGNNDYEGPDALHGTHVGAIVGAEHDNDLGGRGVSPYAQIMTVRVVPDGDERDKDVANGIIYAVDNGAKVINMSFGKGYSPAKEVVDKAVKYAQKHDVLLVHAAGNASQDNDKNNNFPNARFEKKGLFGPRYAKNWIEVGALAPDQGENMVASFSNYGRESVDIFAPGVQILAAVPDNSYRKLSGTSMASPVVAGAAALLRAYFPELSAKQIKQCLIEGGRTLNTVVRKPGSDDDSPVPFAQLCKHGKILDVYQSFRIAEKMAK